LQGKLPKAGKINVVNNGDLDILRVATGIAPRFLYKPSFVFSSRGEAISEALSLLWE